MIVNTAVKERVVVKEKPSMDFTEKLLESIFLNEGIPLKRKKMLKEALLRKHADPPGSSCI